MLAEMEFKQQLPCNDDSGDEGELDCHQAFENAEDIKIGLCGKQQKMHNPLTRM